MSYTAHLDTFARDHLPPAESQPEFLFDLPELQFPERLNCATELLDRAVKEGRGDRPCVSAPGGPSWTYAELQRQADRIAHVLVKDCGLVHGQPGAAALDQQADARGLLVRGDEGRRHRRRHHADAARQGAEADRREGPGRFRALRPEASRRSRDAAAGDAGAAAHRLLRRPLARRPRGADGAPRRAVRQRRHRGRRHLPARLHLRHHRPAEGDDALPSRRDGELRLLSEARAARRRERRLHRQPAARLHLRPGRADPVSDGRRRLDGAAREGRAERAARGAGRPSRHRALHRADLVSRHGRGGEGAPHRRARRRRAAQVRLRRRGAARRHPRALEARPPASS